VNALLLTGTGHPDLARQVALEAKLPFGSCGWRTFPDGEVSVSIGEPLFQRDVVLFQPTHTPVNEHVVELLALADACRRAGARRITAVIPYFGYARSDRRSGQQEPIMASLMARLIEAAGIEHVITLDLHAAQIEGFFSIPVQQLSAAPVIAAALQPILPLDVAVVAPDAGAIRLAERYAHVLGADVVILDKRRDAPTHTAVMHVVGDVADRSTLIVDDMISTGETIIRAVEALVRAGASDDITVAATHGLLIGSACQRLDASAARRIFVTDSVPHRESAWMKLRIIPIGPLLAEAVRRVTPATLAEEPERTLAGAAAYD
jgi:ribose-phosphate pyrophosphokinase